VVALIMLLETNRIIAHHQTGKMERKKKFFGDNKPSVVTAMMFKWYKDSIRL